MHDQGWNFPPKKPSRKEKILNFVRNSRIYRILWVQNRYLATKQIRVKSPSEKDLHAYGIAGRRLAVLAAYGAIAFIVGSFVFFSLFRGAAPAAQPVKLPPVQATPTFVPIVNVWDGYGKLTQAEARDLRMKNNVLNLGLLDGGGVTYLTSYGVNFNPENPNWQKMNEPPGFTHLSVAGTSIQVGVDNQTYALNMYQGFVRVKDPQNLYVVDKDGNIWSTRYSPDVLVPLAQLKAPIQIAPNPNLNLTY